MGTTDRAGARRAGSTTGTTHSQRGSSTQAGRSLEGRARPVVAGAFELGRAVAPVCLLDEATLGAPLAIGGRATRSGGRGPAPCLSPVGARSRATRWRPITRADARRDGHGPRFSRRARGFAPDDAEARWTAWTAATLSYLAGVANASFEAALNHARVREQFGRPLPRCRQSRRASPTPLSHETASS